MWDREGEPGATSDVNRRKRYALPYNELQYYDYFIDERICLDRIRQRYARRGLRPPSSQRWLHYIIPEMRTRVTETDSGDSPNCGNARDNNGVAFPFWGGNIFQLFPVVSGDPRGLIERQNEWPGGSLIFRQEANPTAAAYHCWSRTWNQRSYYIRWLNKPQAFWDEVLSDLCARSGTDSPCCTENIVGFYVDEWIDWFLAVRGVSTLNGRVTPILPEDWYTTEQAHEAYLQFAQQLRYIARELDAARESRPPDYTPEICSNTYSAMLLQVSSSPYPNSYVIPDDEYLDRTYYINRESEGYPIYTNPGRHSDSILLEVWWWDQYVTELIDGNSDQTGIYKSKQVGSYSRDAAVLLALRHGLKVFLQVPHAVSKDDYELKVIQIARFWSQYRTQFPNQIYFMERNHREVPRILNTSERINFVPFNDNPRDRRAGYPQPVSRLLRWNYDANPRFRPIKLTLDHGEAQ